MKNTSRPFKNTCYTLSIIVGIIISQSAVANPASPVYQLDVTYTEGSVLSGPVSFGLSSFPTSVTSSFTLTAGFVNAATGEHFFEEGEIVSADVSFGDATWSTSSLKSFSMIFVGRDIIDLTYEFFPITTQVVDGGIALNFPLIISGIDKATGQPFEYQYTESSHSLTTLPQSLSVAIDIKPGSDENSINLCSNGAIPLAILGTNDFNVSTINTDTLRFSEASVKMVGKKEPHSLCSYEDVNVDYIEDLVCHFITTDIAGIDGESTTASVNGELFDGTPFEGSDSINIVKDTCH